MQLASSVMDDFENESLMTVQSVPNMTKREDDGEKNHKGSENGDEAKEKEKNAEVNVEKHEINVNVLQDDSGVVRFSNLKKMLEDMKEFK